MKIGSPIEDSARLPNSPISRGRLSRLPGYKINANQRLSQQIDVEFVCSSWVEYARIMAKEPKNISLSPKLMESIERRAEADGESFSEIIRQLVGEAGDNFEQLRSDLRKPLDALRLQLARVRGCLTELSPGMSAERFELIKETTRGEVKACEDSVDGISQRLLAVVGHQQAECADASCPPSEMMVG